MLSLTFYFHPIVSDLDIYHNVFLVVHDYTTHVHTCKSKVSLESVMSLTEKTADEVEEEIVLSPIQFNQVCTLYSYLHFQNDSTILIFAFLCRKMNLSLLQLRKIMEVKITTLPSTTKFSVQPKYPRYPKMTPNHPKNTGLKNSKISGEPNQSYFYSQ